MKPFHYVWFILLPLAGASCGLLDATPACDDAQVTAKVQELHGQRLKETLVRERFRNPMGMLDLAALFEGSDLKLSDLPKLTYAKLEPHRVKSQRIREFLTEIDAEAAQQRGPLSGFRLVSKDDATKKATCAASMTPPKGNAINLEYTAQFTLDKKLHVELP